MQNLKFISSAGVPQTPSDAYGTTTLAAGTYYAELHLEKVRMKGLMSLHWKYDGALVATITIEGTNFQEVKLNAALNSGWATQPPATVSPAASAGETLSSWADVGTGRLRAKIVVGTQGVLRGAFNIKAG